jgi:hypothetical protein
VLLGAGQYFGSMLGNAAVDLIVKQSAPSRWTASIECKFV